MRYFLAGCTYQIRSLEKSLDTLFTQLHAAYLGPTPFYWEEFKQIAVRFLSNTPPHSELNEAYFNNFNLVWNQLLVSRRFDEAETLWEMALDPALEVEKRKPDHKIHKGTPYYFWGMTAILRGDIDKGYALMHQAVEEDVATTQNQFPDTPAYALATLNWAKQDQAFRQWVLAQAQFLDEKQNKYSTIYSRPFTLENFRQRFLSSPPSTEDVFLFVYTVARLMRLGNAPEHTVQSRFAGQLFMSLFSDMLVVIESALKFKNPNGRSFINHAEYLSQKACDPISNTRLRELNKMFNDDFDTTLTELLNGNFSFPDQTKLTKLQSEIAIAYGLRNRAFHNTSPTPAMWQRFSEIMQILFNVMFTMVDYVYA
ncbi:MAG TPA: hypothetical protein VMW81_00955 [Nitrospinota bacterium]|nr:hypothetical protein [Nitrospinota bacterium]